MRLRLTTLLAALALGLAACGGDDGGSSDEDQIRELVTVFYESEEGVCDSVTDNLLETQFDSREDCEAAAADAEPAEDYEIEEVSVEGDDGRVTVSVEDQTGTLLVKKQDGDWKVDGIEQ